MRTPRTRRDDQPFKSEGSGGADVSRLVGGERLAQLVEGGASNAFRANVESWARERGLPVEGSEIVIVVEGVVARVALYEITEATAIVRATAAHPVTMSLTVEPKSWAQRIKARFGAGFATGDVGFDGRWSVVTTDVRAAEQLLAEDCREALRDVACWCRTTYTDGAIEIRLDGDRLAGAHVLDGIDLALTLGNVRIQSGMYR